MPSMPHAAERVERDEVWARRQDPALLLVDVRSREAFAAGHITGSLSLPVDDIPTRAPLLLPERGAEIILYCGSFT